MFGRNQLAILVAEFLGSGALALVMLTVQHSTIGLPYFVALLAGLVLAVMTVVLGRGGAAHFNPAVTIGMWTVRQIKTVPAVSYIVVQMLGGWVAYYLYTYFTRTHLTTIGGHYDSHILVAEAVGAFVLTLAWGAVVFGRMVSTQTGALLGAAYAVAIVVAASASIGIVNPAVALSMRAFNVFGSMGWGTYALGPVLGAVIGFNLYALLFAPESSFVTMAAAVGGRFARPATTAPASVSTATTKAAPKRKTASRRRTTKRSR